MHRFIRNSHELNYRWAAESTHPLFVPPRTFSLVRHWKRWGLRRACSWPHQDDGENELVQPGFVLPQAWDENLLSLRERVVSALCCVLMERSVVFLVLPTVQAHCRSPTGRSFNRFKRSASILYSSLHLTLDSAIARPREGRERAAEGPREGREMSKLHPRDPAVEKNHKQVRQVQYTWLNLTVFAWRRGSARTCQCDALFIWPPFFTLPRGFVVEGSRRSEWRTTGPHVSQEEPLRIMSTFDFACSGSGTPSRKPFANSLLTFVFLPAQFRTLPCYTRLQAAYHHWSLWKVPLSPTDMHFEERARDLACPFTSCSCSLWKRRGLWTLNQSRTCNMKTTQVRFAASTK